MKRISLSVMFALIVLFTVSASLNAGGEPLRISKEEVKAKLGHPNFIVLDVRTGSDWSRSEEKIVGAVRVNPEKIAEWSSTLAKDKEIVLYCAWRSEGTSARVAQELTTMGFDAKALKGGWKEWSEAKYPVEKK